MIKKPFIGILGNDCVYLKRERGLGCRDIELFNQVLLGNKTSMENYLKSWFFYGKSIKGEILSSRQQFYGNTKKKHPMLRSNYFMEETKSRKICIIL